MSGRSRFVRGCGLGLALLALAPGCAHGNGEKSAADATGGASAASASGPSGGTGKGPNAAPEKAITFIDDDYARAFAEAKASHRLLFVDAWAPWCHTCLSMRSYVFDDPALAPIAKRFVWLAIDTEKDSNAPFLAKYPMSVWPTLWVVDPARETPVLKWLGSATGVELAQLLDDAANAGGKSETGAESGGEAGAAFLRGKQASAAGKRDDAIAQYRAALAAAPATWKRRPQVVEALAAALQEAKNSDACVALARAEVPKLPKGTSLANVALTGLSCARQIQGDPTAKNELAAAVRRIADDRSQPILADDRSGLYEELVDISSDAKDGAAAKATARAWAGFLEEEAARAKTPAARAVFDAHRAEAYVALGEPGRAIPMLEASAKDFPDDYNPPARLAFVYRAMGKYEDALVAVDRALSKVYGGRALRVYGLKADILGSKGDSAGAAATLREALAKTANESLPPNYQKAREALAKRADSLAKTK